MNSIKQVFVVLGLVIGCSFTAQSQDREQLNVELSNPAKEGILKLNLVTGSIKVIGYEGKEVLIDAISSERNERRSKERADGMRRIQTTSGFELLAKEANNTVNVSVDKVNLKVLVTVRVPRRFSLKLSTVNEGDIFVENVIGNMEVSNVNGAIRLKNVAGAVVANTVNEDVVVNLLTITPNTPMAFTTLNGNVDVSFPASAKANLKFKTDMGEIFSDFDLDVEKNVAPPKQSINKEKGLYKIQKDDWTHAKINKGGAEIMLKSFNGNIYIRKTN